MARHCWADDWKSVERRFLLQQLQNCLAHKILTCSYPSLSTCFQSSSTFLKSLSTYLEYSQTLHHHPSAQFQTDQILKQIKIVQKSITTKMKAKEDASAELSEKATLEKGLDAQKKKTVEKEEELRRKAGGIGNLVDEKAPVSEKEVSNLWSGVCCIHGNVLRV